MVTVSWALPSVLFPINFNYYKKDALTFIASASFFYKCFLLTPIQGNSLIRTFRKRTELSWS